MKTNISIIAFLALMICTLMLIQSDVQPMKLKNEVEEGRLYCFVKDELYWSKIEGFCAKDNYIYVLFGDKGVLKIYDCSGKYLRSYAFCKTKGKSAIYIEDENVYLYDQSRNYYVFSEGKPVDFGKHENYNLYVNKLSEYAFTKNQRETDNSIYYLKGASVFRQDSDSASTCIIKRPWYLTFFQGGIPFVVISLLIGIIMLCIYKCKK